LREIPVFLPDRGRRDGLTEAAGKFGDAWVENQLRQENEQCNPGLYRIALKMATGSGKTVAMSMLIAWQALNKFANPQDARFTDSFLILTPGITIRDRLRVLLPNDSGNYYDEFDTVPGHLHDELHRGYYCRSHARLVHGRDGGRRIVRRMYLHCAPECGSIICERRASVRQWRAERSGGYIELRERSNRGCLWRRLRAGVASNGYFPSRWFPLPGSGCLPRNAYC